MNPATASAFFGRPRFRMSEAQAVVELCCRDTGYHVGPASSP